MAGTASDRELTLGAAQIAECYLDREATIEKDCEYISRAGEQGIDLLVFPEFHVPASPYWYAVDPDHTRNSYYRALYENAVTVPGPAVDEVCEAAAGAGVAVVLGVNERDPNPGTGTMYNTQVFIDSDGTLLGSRRKLRPTVDERLFHSGGTGQDLRVFESTIGTLGGLLCAEHVNHLAGFATLALGEEIHAACWPAYCAPVVSDEICEFREEMIGVRTRFHSFAGKVPSVIATGGVTDELAAAIGNPELETGGGPSAVVGPDGRYVAGPDYEMEAIVSATVDLDDRIEQQANHDVIGHYNRFDIFNLEINTDSQEAITVLDDAE